MTMFSQFEITIPNDGSDTTIGNSATLDISQLTECGFDYIRDGSAAFAASLKGSVTGLNWTEINDLTASAQGTIGGHYNYLRVEVADAEVLGATTQLKIAGRNG